MFKLMLSFWMLLSVSVGYKILVLFPLSGKSHSILGEAYVRNLLHDGHEVTYITPFPLKNSPNLTQIKFEDPNVPKYLDVITFEKILNNEQNLDLFMLPLFVETAENVYKTPEIQKLLRDQNTHFDLVIIEWLFSEASSGLSAVLDCPFVWAASTEPGWMTFELIDESRNPAYSPDFMSSNLPPHGFLTRVQELFTRIFLKYYKDVKQYKIDKAAYEKIFTPFLAEKGKALPSFDDVRLNASLMFGNTHISLGQTMAYPQNYKTIGGYHIKPDFTPLPEDLQKLMDNSKEGVIYFSMGSNLKSSGLPEKIKKDFLQVFGSLKQTVIWKFEEELPNTPKNVKIVQWAPQPAILSHPNCRLFITHGGLLSTIETIHYGVPIIGLPAFADQFTNVNVAVAKGYAKKITWSYNIGQELKEAIDEVLTNPRYTEKVKELSFIYHHRPVPPAQELKHWVRHVIETGGAPHLRSVALRTPFYQKYYLDFLALILIVVFIFVRIGRALLKNSVPKVKKN